MADATSGIREAVHLLEMKLPALPLGTEQHKAVVEALGKLSKAFPASEEVPGVQHTQLQALAQKAQQSAMMQALLRQSQQGAAPPGGGAPGGPPPPDMQQGAA
jgi:hypothetical protein